MKTFLKYFFTFLFGLLFGFGIIVVVVLVAIASAGSNFSDDEIEIPNASVLKITLPTVINELPQEESFSSILSELSGTQSMSLPEIRQIFHKAATDNRIAAIHLDAGLYSSGLAIAAEIRDAIDSFQKSGKPIWAYSENYTEQGLFVASTCDKIIANPKGMAEFNGFSSGVMMYKGLFDKLGVGVQVFKVGKFKGAVEPFSQEYLSDNNKEQIQAYLNSLHKNQLSQISQDRKIPFETLDSFSKFGNYLDIKEVKSIGLIDQLWYQDEFEGFVKKSVPGFKWLNSSKYRKDKSDYTYAEDKVAVLYLEGEIVPGKSQSEGQIASEDVCKELKKIRENKDIKALVLRINSPGGSSVASDIIAREVDLTKKVKPVIASFSNVAASGGYYIAALADSIFADRKSITGSIGVFAMIPNTSKLYKEKLGLNYETISTGPQAELWRPDQPLTEIQQRMIQQMVDQVYVDFVGIVSKGRKIPMERVKEIAEGRVYSGEQAKELGLIDNYGGQVYSIQVAARKANLKDFKVVSYPEPKNAFEALFEALDSKTRLSISHDLPLADELLETKKLLKSMEGIQARIPWSTDLR